MASVDPKLCAAALALSILAGCTVDIPPASEFACGRGGPCGPARDASARDTSEDDDGGVTIEDGAIVRPDAQPPGDGAPRDATFLDATASSDAAPRDATAGTDAQPGDTGPRDTGPRPDATTPDAGGCGAGEVTCAGGCRPADECTACTADNQCPSGQCHPVLDRCIPAGRLELCDPCTTSAQCGLREDLCILLPDSNGVTLESVCGTSCATDADCERGYYCNNLDQCYPRPGLVRTHTCAAYRDMLAAEACNSQGSDTCGVPNFSDGTCLFLFETCVVGCSSQNDCPIGSTCTDIAGFFYCFAD